MSTVIRVENLGKKYAIGSKEAKRDTIREVIVDTLKAPFNRFRKLAGTNQDDSSFWALKDVSFDVQQGEVVGIIGRNGAGKSTLLKILSKIVEPTEGVVKIKGRISSLLEVGTGFHPELTGRENIYLNGAIIGMARAEINRKFDEIVAFSEIEKFLDTPVKRYSSGMYVRLAFAVAAHLEPEILIIDEVLAVGDAAFQKKCLGKMGEVGRSGRTVLFVSHNMAAISSLCNKTALLGKGSLLSLGDTDKIIDQYLINPEKFCGIPLDKRSDREGSGQLKFTALTLLDENYSPIAFARSGNELTLAIDFERKDQNSANRFVFEVGVYNRMGQLVFLCGNDFAGERFTTLPPIGRIYCHIPSCPLQPGYYDLNLYCGSMGNVSDWVRDAMTIQVVDGKFFNSGRLPPANGGLVLVQHHWVLDK